MANPIQSIRGMNDILPGETPYWQHIEAVVRETMQQYGFSEIRTPVLEKTELFCRSVGEVTDIVEKEMYTFTDRNGDSLSLRPENTASTLRAGIEAGLFYNQIQKLWYAGPQFRHERPQRGRLRQFHQVGVEIIGIDNPAIDAELLLLFSHVLKKLNLTPYVNLEINSLGTKEDRLRYREALVTYFKRYEAQLDEECQRRLQTNPLRLLDSKNPDMQALISDAPAMQTYLSDASKRHFELLCAYLNDNQLAFTVNPRLVRGLDYYCLTVFEWVTTHLGAQGTVCAGGRYDGLIEQLGGHAAPGIGFAMGMERLIALLQDLHPLDTTLNAPDVYMILSGENALPFGLSLSERLRHTYPHLRLSTDLSNASFKSQMKKADKSGAPLVLIIGEQEMVAEHITVKYLREDKPQQQLTADAVMQLLGNQLYPS